MLVTLKNQNQAKILLRFKLIEFTVLEGII